VKKILILFLVVTIPVLLSFEVWQVFRFRSLKQETLSLQAQQKDWLEENKKVLANISLFGSPERIEKLSEGTLGLERIDDSRVLTIKRPGGRGF
jgi:cell division protein FtsL